MDVREVMRRVVRQERLLLEGDGDNYVVRTKVNGRSVGSIGFRKIGGYDVIDSAVVLYDPKDLRQMERAIQYAARLTDEGIDYTEQPDFAEIRGQVLEAAEEQEYPNGLLHRIADRTQDFKNSGVHVKIKGRVKSK